MKLALSLCVGLSDAQGGQTDPTAPCGSRDAACCESKDFPVMGGIDFVDLASKAQAVDGPDLGSSEHSATLNGYTFNFKTAENAAAFEADPWRFAPRYGAF